MKYSLGQKVRILVTRKEANFDRACDEAYRQAIGAFEVDESGHIINVEGAERSDHGMFVEFDSYQVSGSMVGIVHYYSFEAWVG